MRIHKQLLTQAREISILFSYTRQKADVKEMTGMKQDDLNNSTADLDVAEEADNQFAPAMEIEDADAEKVAGGRDSRECLHKVLY